MRYGRQRGARRSSYYSKAVSKWAASSLAPASDSSFSQSPTPPPCAALPYGATALPYGTDMRCAINRLTTGPRASRELSVRLIAKHKPSVCFCVSFCATHTDPVCRVSQYAFAFLFAGVARCAATANAPTVARVSSTLYLSVTPTHAQ